jgi:sulfur carrier protein
MSEHVSTPLSTNSSSLRFNGQQLELTDPLSLSELLARHGIAADSVATAVNGQFVQRGQRAATALRCGDEVLTFQAIVGG